MKLIVVGKKCEYQSQIDDYLKRLRQPFSLEILELPYSAKKNVEARNEESSAILQKVSPKDYLILLEERGKQLDNYEFSKTLSANTNIVLVIGGAYGVNEELRSRANLQFSLGKLVFPHEIVRLILVEQIYRSFAIYNNHPYHHV